MHAPFARIRTLAAATVPGLFATLAIPIALGVTTAPVAAQTATLPPVGIETSASASYDGVVGSMTDSAGNPGSASSSVNVGPGGPGLNLFFYGPVLDASLADARAGLPGTIGSRALAGGFNPSFGPGGSTDAFATARTVTHWVASSNDPALGSVPIDVLAFFDGVLVTADFAGASFSATARAEMAVWTAGGRSVVFAGEGTLNSSGALSATGEWIGEFTLGSNASGSVRFAELDYTEFFADAFVVNVNVPFAWEVILTTQAAVPGPFELHAIADFFNTGSTDLSVDTQGVMLTQIGVVPETPVWLAMLLGLPLVLRRRFGAR
ncbi:MAG: hypothetical protein H6932_00570 [Burkholderiaceae bacterium]|nr:hypothetical protein [Burkholderiaceae bacterium]